MRLISPFLKRVVYPGLSQVGYLRRYARDGKLCVVTYHGVRPQGYQSIDPMLDGSLVTLTALRGQLRLLKERYSVVTPEDVRQWIETGTALPPRAVLVTCDDGLQNTFLEMTPLLEEENVSCLFFVTAASTTDVPQMLWYEQLYLMLLAAPAGPIEIETIGVKELLGERNRRRGSWWNMVRLLSRCDASRRTLALEKVRDACGLSKEWQAPYREDGTLRRRFYLLTADELSELAARGMSIGAHTISHPVLTRADDELAWAEIAESRNILGRAIQRPIWALAYPFGDAGSVATREIEMAQRAGYSAAFVNHGGGFGTLGSCWEIPRVHVTADMTLGEFEAHVAGLHDSLKSLVAGRA